MDLRQKFSLLLLIFIAAFFMADQNLLPPNYQIIMKEFHVSEPEIGLVSSAFVATSSVITIVWGLLSDIVSRKKLLLIGVLAGELPCFLTSFVQNYWQLLALRILTGIGIGSIIPVAYTLISDLFEEEKRGKGYGLIATSFGFGTLFGMVLAGLIPSWRLPFIIVSLPNFVLAPLFYIVFKEPIRGSGDKVVREAYEKGIIYNYRLSIDAIKKSFKTITNILIFAQGAVGTMPWGVLLYWLVSFFIVVRGMTKETATMILLLIGIATVLGNLFGGILGDIFDKKLRGGRALLSGVAIFAGIFVALYILIYPFPSSPSILTWIFIALYSLLLVQIISYAGPNVTTIISHVNLPEDRGTVFGVYNILNSIGSAIGPFFGGLLISLLMGLGYSRPAAYQYALMIAVLFWIPCSLIWIWIYRTYPKDRERIQSILRSRLMSRSDDKSGN